MSPPPLLTVKVVFVLSASLPVICTAVPPLDVAITPPLPSVNVPFAGVVQDGAHVQHERAAVSPHEDARAVHVDHAVRRDGIRHAVGHSAGGDHHAAGTRAHALQGQTALTFTMPVTLSSKSEAVKWMW
ncbi:MAG TPA: hypothetical protein VFG14_03360 [Chthoniobacteraceae bacterium]|jgi:hypothetical protein|nr:hypothetical protein [Chthoniobacteraceae bacterium]